ncbi:hypothetical protein APR04_006014 [Promicromonospora umidemergens]|uniref:Uncharacterized protein n=1 Tax=Promicromonospora umidemergens TaxID=629679 RepID=A0ABP8WH23_9MICO|nr:hypothetical protein [Promicromonospora umidemergens]MCP2287067.1 hypothetical protein [Promicromonospora umidemergens]
MSDELAWVDVQACTLPTVERPLRLAEFYAVFADHLVDVTEQSATSAALHFIGGDDVSATLADLTARESQCCSFFEFELTDDNDSARLAVNVPPAHADVLTALVERARLMTAGGVR